MTKSERVYRKLLLLYPRSFRAGYEEEMVRVYLDQERDAGQARRGARAALWVHLVIDIAASAPREHLRKEAAVAKRIDPGSVALGTSPREAGPTRLGYALASIPFILLIGAPLIMPGLFEPIFANPPEILGLPAGIVTAFLVATWASLAFVAIRLTRSRLGIALALLVFTVPAIIAILAMPAMILIILNLNV